MQNEGTELRLAEEKTAMTFESGPSAVACESEMTTVTYTVRATEESYREQARRQAVEDGAGFLDGIGLSVKELIKEHENAARNGF
jgi:predicted metalloprotease with PDZ domain